MIQVVKRDSSVEPLCVDRLRACLWRAMGPAGGRFSKAHHLSRAIQLYLHRTGAVEVSSRALFEMAVRALRLTRHDAAADALEAHSRRRRDARRSLKVVHDSGRRTRWDRSWLTAQIRTRWGVSGGAARAISAAIETELLDGRSLVERGRVLDLIDERVENFGLAPWCLLASAPTR